MAMPYWYLPYVLNGLPTAVTTGREIYGYPKQHAASRPPDRQSLPGSNARTGPLRARGGNGRHEAAVHAFDMRLPPETGRGVRAEGCADASVSARSSGRARCDGSAATDYARPSPDDFDVDPGRPGEDDSRARQSRAAEPANAFRPPRRSAGPAVGRGPTSSSAHPLGCPLRLPAPVPRSGSASLASYQALVIGRLVPDSRTT